MTSYYLALGFYITLMLSVKFLVWVYTTRKQRSLKEAQQLSNLQKEIEHNRLTSQETVNNILAYSKSHTNTAKFKKKYSNISLN